MAVMPMTGTERAKLDFQDRFDAVKNRNGWTNKDLAKVLKVSTVTVSRLRSNPFGASGRNVMTINALYEEAMSR